MHMSSSQLVCSPPRRATGLEVEGHRPRRLPHRLASLVYSGSPACSSRAFADFHAAADFPDFMFMSIEWLLPPACSLFLHLRPLPALLDPALMLHHFSPTLDHTCESSRVRSAPVRNQCKPSGLGK